MCSVLAIRSHRRPRLNCLAVDAFWSAAAWSDVLSLRCLLLLCVRRCWASPCCACAPLDMSAPSPTAAIFWMISGSPGDGTNSGMWVIFLAYNIHACSPLVISLTPPPPPLFLPPLVCDHALLVFPLCPSDASRAPLWRWWNVHCSLHRWSKYAALTTRGMWVVVPHPALQQRNSQGHLKKTKKTISAHRRAVRGTTAPPRGA